MTPKDIMAIITNAIRPPMSRDKALDFLAEIESEIELITEGIEEDIEREQE